VQGTETWTHIGANDASRRFPQAVQRHAVGPPGHRDRALFSKTLGVLEPSPMPHPRRAGSCT
jgi:hypothetical protein